MQDSQPLHFYKRLSAWKESSERVSVPQDSARLEPATCVEAEPFALQVLDESMQPEFRKGCVILVDPTGRVQDGCYVLARTGSKTATIDFETAADDSALDDLMFRQLLKCPDSTWALKPLNDEFDNSGMRPCELSDIVGVIVQRAGVRRRYHKRYDT